MGFNSGFKGLIAARSDI